MSASYGVGDQRIDVTRAVQTLVSHEVLVLRAPWALGKEDPAPGQVKEARIVYRLNGVESTATFNQEQHIILPPKPEGLVIVRAAFGIRDRRVDVTEALRQRVQDGELAITAKWFLGEVDPAHGSLKTVEILYLHAGAPKTATFSEEQRIILPPPLWTRGR